MEEEDPLLQPKQAARDKLRYISYSTGFLPKVKLRLARIIKDFRRSVSHLRLKKPSCRLSLCMQKASKFTRRKTKGTKPHVPYHLHSYNDGCHHIQEEKISETLSLLHFQTSHKDANVPFRPHHILDTPERSYSNPHYAHDRVTSCNLQRHALMGSRGNNRLKARFLRWQSHGNEALTSLGPRKGSVPRDVPKGCVGIYVGVDHTRFVVPIPHLNHPLFANLFECMHENDGFSKSGPLWIPCDVTEFELLHSQVKQMSKKHRHRYSL